MRSHLRWRLGDVAGAERDARESLDAALAGQFVFTATSLAGLLDALVERGQIAEADAALRATGFADEIPDLLVGNHLVSPRARVRIAQRRYSDALVDLRELHRRAQVWPAGDPRAYSYRAQLAEVLALLGERDEARWFAAEDLARANEWRTPRAIGIALRAQGLAAATGEAATRLLEESVEVLASAPAPLERARSLIHLGAAKRRDGDRTQARETLRQAIDLADRCGALAVKDWAALELNAAGGHLRRERLSGVEALTPAELRVAQLAADGLTNREIAQTLFLSPKTIEMHLHRTYRKLDLSSRRQLRVALAADHEA
jgi:DNA-binding CsgD family transcriptional regulator